MSSSFPYTLRSGYEYYRQFSPCHTSVCLAVVWWAVKLLVVISAVVGCLSSESLLWNCSVTISTGCEGITQSAVDHGGVVSIAYIFTK